MKNLMKKLMLILSLSLLIVSCDKERSIKIENNTIYQCNLDATTTAQKPDFIASENRSSVFFTKAKFEDIELQVVGFTHKSEKFRLVKKSDVDWIIERY